MMYAWKTLHEESQRLVIRVEIDPTTTRATRILLRRAALLELMAFESLSAAQPRTRGITAVSACALLRRGYGSEIAKRHAAEFLSDDTLPEFARTQLAEFVRQDAESAS